MLSFFLYNFYDVLNSICIFNNRYGFMIFGQKYLKSAKITEKLIIKLQRQDRELAAQERRAKAFVINRLKKINAESKA